MYSESALEPLAHQVSQLADCPHWKTAPLAGFSVLRTTQDAPATSITGWIRIDGFCATARIEGTQVKRNRDPGLEVIKMKDRTGFVSRLWRMAKDQIAQPVPPEDQFCEFQCPYKRCLLETTGSCEIRPGQTLVVLRTTLTSSGGAWVSSAATGPVPPARVA